jgi:hypothetical protein
VTTIDTARIRRELLDASEHLFRPNFVCCEGCRIAGTRVIELVEAVEEAQADVRAWAVPMVVYAIQHHEIDPAVKTPKPTPGTDCREWCASCRLLPGIPADVLAAAEERIAEWALLDSLEPPF